MTVDAHVTTVLSDQLLRHLAGAAWAAHCGAGYQCLSLDRVRVRRCEGADAVCISWEYGPAYYSAHGDVVIALEHDAPGGAEAIEQLAQATAALVRALAAISRGTHAADAKRVWRNVRRHYLGCVSTGDLAFNEGIEALENPCIANLPVTTFGEVRDELAAARDACYRAAAALAPKRDALRLASLPEDRGYMAALHAVRANAAVAVWCASKLARGKLVCSGEETTGEVIIRAIGPLHVHTMRATTHCHCIEGLERSYLLRVCSLGRRIADTDDDGLRAFVARYIECSAMRCAAGWDYLVFEDHECNHGRWRWKEEWMALLQGVPLLMRAQVELQPRVAVPEESVIAVSCLAAEVCRYVHLPRLASCVSREQHNPHILLSAGALPEADAPEDVLIG